MKRLVIASLVVFAAVPAYAAISAHTVWEVRTTGSDLNGGGFDLSVASPGTDYSQQDSPQVTFDGATITASNGGTSSTITISGYTVLATDAGNTINISGGTNFTVGVYTIVLTSVSANTWTLDRACTSGAGASMTGRMGGAFAGLAQLAGKMVGSNKAFIQSGTYAAAAVTFSPGNVTPSATIAPTTIEGYYQTRGDIYPGTNASFRPVIQGTTTATTPLTFNNNGWRVRNLQVEKGGAAATIAVGIGIGGTQGEVSNCKVRHTTSQGILFSDSFSIGVFNEITDCTAGTGIWGCTNGTCVIEYNYVHDNSGMSSGIRLPNNGSRANFNVVVSNSGASADGISVGIDSSAKFNTVYGSGRDGIRLTSASTFATTVRGNLLVSNGGYGFNQATASWPASWRWDGNAYYNNTSGTRNNVDNTTGINGIGAYTNTNDVILTGDPFTNAAGGEFTLNNIAGAGAAARGSSGASGIPGLSYRGYRDFGAIQHQDLGTNTFYDATLIGAVIQ